MIISENNLKEFVKDFRQTVKELEKKYDVSISLGRITYEKGRFTTRMTVNNSRDPEEIARAEFDANAWKYAHLGLAPGMYKRVFIGMNGEHYAIIGLNTRAPKYPLTIVRIRDGQLSRAPEHFIRTLLNEYYQESVVIPTAALPDGEQDNTDVEE